MEHLSEAELGRISAEKAKRRLELRQEYLKEVHNPYRHAKGEGGTLFDAGLQRFQAMTVSNYDHFKPTAKAARVGGFVVVLPMLIYGYLIKNERDTREKKVRSGLVSYRDRRFKFI